MLDLTEAQADRLARSPESLRLYANCLSRWRKSGTADVIPSERPLDMHPRTVRRAIAALQESGTATFTEIRRGTYAFLPNGETAAALRDLLAAIEKEGYTARWPRLTFARLCELRTRWRGGDAGFASRVRDLLLGAAGAEPEVRNILSYLTKALQSQPSGGAGRPEGQGDIPVSKPVPPRVKDSLYSHLGPRRVFAPADND